MIIEFFLYIEISFSELYGQGWHPKLIYILKHLFSLANANSSNAGKRLFLPADNTTEVLKMMFLNKKKYM